MTEMLGGSAFARTTADEAAAPTPAPKLGNEIGGLIDAGEVRVTVATVLPLAEAGRAHELSESGHARGKIVLHVAD